MNKRSLFKYGVLILICVILFPLAPLILGIYGVYKIIKSNYAKNRKLGLIILVVIFSFFLTGKIVDALPSSPSSTPKPEVKSEQIESTPIPTTEPSPTATPDPNIITIKVVNVVDGDTFKIESGETVRMIGIDTPETVHPSKPIQCYGKEASQKTEDLIQGKEVRLEKDVSETDRYGRLLRYVYVGDIFVNEYLVKEGFAMSSSYPPDIKYQNKFIEAQKKAQEENKGLWNQSNCPTATPKPITTSKPSTPRPTTTSYYPAATNQTSSTTTGGSYVCNCSKTCSQMSSCAEAQYQLNVCGCSARDADDDGIACDSDCQ